MNYGFRIQKHIIADISFRGLQNMNHDAQANEAPGGRKVISMRARLCMCLSVGLGFWAVAPANCQTSAGAIVGVIRDASGAAVPGARITTTNQGTNISSPFVTDETGNYYIPSLLPGRYRVEAEKKGFKKVTARDIEVAVNQPSVSISTCR